MNEASITKAVMDHWKQCGLPDTLVASIPNMGARGQFGLTKGLPDLLVLGGNVKVGFIELKTDKGKPSLHQLAFEKICQAIGIPFHFTYGRDEPINILKSWRIIK